MDEKLVSVLKGAAIAAAGAVLAWLTEFAARGEAGVWGPVLTALLSVAVNALRKYGLPDKAGAEGGDDEAQ